jgi:hypothetical protein
MLKGQHRVFYLHGEIAAPAESVVIGCERIYLPIAQTGAKMIAMGVPESDIVQSGLVLEPELLEGLDEAVQRRADRMKDRQPLTVGFFISGAYPVGHIRLMLLGAQACYRAGMRVRFFWGSDRSQVHKLIKEASRFMVGSSELALDDGKAEQVHDSRIVIVHAGSRERETLIGLRYLPQLDLFCAAPHERVNWAVGAGLPMVMISPPIGTFAPENMEYVSAVGCGVELSSREQFLYLPNLLQNLRESGELAAMVSRGHNRSPVDGAAVIAENLAAALE